MSLRGNVDDRHHVDSDPGLAFYYVVVPDTTFHFDADPCGTLDPDPQYWPAQWGGWRD